MGDPIAADPAAKPTEAGPAQPQQSSSKKEQPKGDEWAEKWKEIQGPSDSVKWDEHFQVCALKYRYRNYDELLRCLDLFEAKVAAGGKQVEHIEEARKASPALTGWLRATAYAELGEPQIALKWAESAWSVVPETFRQARYRPDQMFPPRDVRDFVGGCVMAGGWSRFGDPTRWGRDNPAGLDLKPETITMSLSAQRSLLYQHLGDTDKARAALEDLRKWDVRSKDEVVAGIFSKFVPIAKTSAPNEGQAKLLSIGPHFAMGDYATVVTLYEEVSHDVETNRERTQFWTTVGSVVFLPWAISGAMANAATNAVLSPFTPSDARLFAVAVEDASNALIYAQSLARVGKTDAARKMFDTLLALPEIRGMGNLYWVALYERGLIARADGQRAEAIRLFTQSVDAIERVRSTISFEAAKIGFAGDKQAVYGALVSALADSGAWSDAFVIAERAKARAFVDLLAQKRDLGPPPAADDKVRELFANATTSGETQGLPSTEEGVRGIQIVASARAALTQVAPEAASLVTVQKVSVTDIAARLGEHETLIDYYSSGDDLFAFLLQGTTVRGFKLSAQGLAEDVRSFREAIERRDASVAERGRRLHDRLMHPLLAEIRGAKLTISPHGALHYLPFAALSDGKQYFLDRFSARFIPSASALVYVKTDTPVKPGKLLALGNPDLGNSRFDLPNAQVEALNVAAMFPASRALVRAAATKTAVKELGNGFSILHFATHGKFDTDAPLSSGLFLAKGNEPDGVLTVSDLYSLRWDMDLVTLSACETGLGKIASGDDVIGLTRGFLYAGARSIVASLWQVDDAATARLMTSFYRNLESNDKREALRLAQLETRASYPQPMYWAAFQVVGRAQ